MSLETLDSLPKGVDKEDITEYLGHCDHNLGTIFGNYILLGIKSIDKYYNKTFFALCKGCWERTKDISSSVYSGQKSKFRKNIGCPCSGRDYNFKDNIKYYVDKVLENTPHIQYVKHVEKVVTLNCSLHGEFKSPAGSFKYSNLKYVCKHCYHEALSEIKYAESLAKAKEFRDFKRYEHPYDVSSPLEYTEGNEFKTKHGNTLEILSSKGRMCTVKCADCKDVKDIYKSNLRKGQCPCSCNGKRSLEIGEEVTTKHGNKLKIVGLDSKYFYVECNICHLDAELYPQPLKVLRGTVYSGGSPCKCAKACLYTKDQYNVLVSRKLSALDCYKGHSIEGDHPRSGSKVRISCEKTCQDYSLNLQYLVLSDKVSCKYCKSTCGGFDDTKEGYMYIMVFEDRELENPPIFKVGISNRKPSERLTEICKRTEVYTGRVYTCVKFTKGYSCREMERIFKRLYVQDPKGCVGKDIFRSGFTETFLWDLGCLQDLLNDFVGYMGIDFTASYYEYVPLEDLDGCVRLLRQEEY